MTELFAGRARSLPYALIGLDSLRWVMPPPDLTASQKDHWLRGWTTQASHLQERRHQLLELAPVLAAALLERWPEARVWVFGAVLSLGFLPIRILILPSRSCRRRT